MAGYIGTTPVPQATQHRESFTATGGQTSFATAGYTPQFIDVYLNGVKLAPADFTATNGSDVVLASGATASDILEIVAYTPFEVANQTFTGTTTAANLTVTGAFTSQGIDDNANATAITIDSSENVGIGTSSVTAGFVLEGVGDARFGDVAGDDAVEIGWSGGGSYAFVQAFDRGATAQRDLLLNSSLRIDSNGRVMIGGTTVTDVNMLNIQGSGASSNIGVVLIYGIQNGGSSLKFHDYSASATRMLIDNSGNLLVGKTSTGFGTSGIELRADNTLFVTRSSNTPAYINRLTSDGNIVEFAKDGSIVGGIGSTGGALFIGSTYGSDSGIRFASDIIAPSTTTGANRDAAIDLGYSSSRFKDLYLSGGVYLGGTGSANKLDDYEEGTFDVALDSGHSGSITLNSSYKTGRYIKIGNTVTFTLHVRISAVSAPSGTLGLTGLPFASPNDHDYRFTFGPCVFFSFTGMTDGDYPVAYLSHNSSTLLFALTNTNSIQNFPANRLTAGSEWYVTGTYQTA
jgi:hypothetical protein